MTGLPGRFRLLWAATGVSNLGDGIRLTALPLLATELTTDPALIAGLAVAERLPWLVFILPGGAWADRYDRRRLRVLLDVIRAVVVAGLAMLIAVDAASLVALYLAAAAMAAAESIVDSSSMALVPALVDEADLERGGARLAATELTMGALIGPPLGGVIFAGALWLPFGIDAITFLLAAVLTAAIPGSFRPARSRGSKTSMWSDIRDGMRWLWNDHLIRNLALISTALGTIGYVTGAVFVLLAREELGLGSAEFGLLLVPPAIGGLIGSALASRLRNRSLRVVLTVAITTNALTSLAIAVTSRAALIGVLLAIEAAAILVWNVLTLALRQRMIPDELLGRVGASYRFLVYVGMPAGAILGGFIASTINVRATFTASGFALLAVAAILPRFVK